MSKNTVITHTPDGLPKRWQYLESIVEDQNSTIANCSVNFDEYLGGANHLTTVSALLLYDQIANTYDQTMESEAISIKFRSPGLRSKDPFDLEIDNSSYFTLRHGRVVEVTARYTGKMNTGLRNEVEGKLSNVDSPIIKKINSMYDPRLNLIKSAKLDLNNPKLIVNCDLNNLPHKYINAWVTACANQAYQLMFEAVVGGIENTVETFLITNHTIRLDSIPKNRFHATAYLRRDIGGIHKVSFITPFSTCETSLFLGGYSMSKTWKKLAE